MVWVRAWLFGIVCLTAAAAGAAETRYVTDQLVVSVRQAPQDAAVVLTSLRSGQGVQLLAEEGRFFKVQLADGRQGYALKQYFTAEAPRAARLAQLEQERDALKTQLAAAVEQARTAAAAPTGSEELQRTLEQVRQELAEAKARLEGAPQQTERTERLQRELQQARGETARLEAEVLALKEDDAMRYATGMIPWFLAGGGVLLVGWLLGKSSRQKRRF